MLSVALVSPTDEQVARRRAFGARLRQLRRDRGLSQEDLGHSAGLDRTYVGSVERGRRNISLDAMWQIAIAMGISPEGFFANTQRSPEGVGVSAPSAEVQQTSDGPNARLPADEPLDA